MSKEVLGFYEGLADEYHLMFADWKEEILRQGDILDAFIRRQLGEGEHAVLDCACGIGTQAIGLAIRGYTIHATDFSPLAVERAAREANALGAQMTCGVADFRSLDATISETFDAVICLDNAISHLLEDADLLRAASQMKARLRPNGVVLISIRDYDLLLTAEPGVLTSLTPGLPGVYSQAGKDRPRGTVPRVFDDADGRRIAFQVWDWNVDGRSYTINQFFVREVDGKWRTSHHATQFRALLRHELDAILGAAGFKDVSWHMPEESNFYQPIVCARA
jgi:glycine/sarcosine N-methyltransferase